MTSQWDFSSYNCDYNWYGNKIDAFYSFMYVMIGWWAIKTRFPFYEDFYFITFNRFRYVKLYNIDLVHNKAMLKIFETCSWERALLFAIYCSWKRRSTPDIGTKLPRLSDLPTAPHHGAVHSEIIGEKILFKEKNIY
jgi:hypothetical protein